MAPDPSSPSNNTAPSSTPFEWLSGGLFFGGGGNKNNAAGNNSNDAGRGATDAMAKIHASRDAVSLLDGIRDNLNDLLTASVGENQKSSTDTNDNVANNDEKAATTTTTKKEQQADSSTPSAAAASPTTPASEPAPPSASQLLAARLSRLRFLLYEERRMTSKQQHDSSPGRGPNRHSPARSSSVVVAETTLQGLTSEPNQDLMPRLVENLVKLPFESRKHVAAIFNYLLVAGLDGDDAALYEPVMTGFRQYVERYYERLMTTIVLGHDISLHGGGNASDVGLHCGSMYRSCLRHPTLYRNLVGATDSVERYVFPFLDNYVHVPNFDVSSDAMESVRLVFTAGGDTVPEDNTTNNNNNSRAVMAEIATEFLTRDYEEVWDQRFNPKLLSGSANYMTRRVSLQILSSVLLSRSNYAVMIRYVSSRKNLILAMELLRDTSPHITKDAFNVFKVFVANPNKPDEIIRILRDNKVKLCRYLTTLHQEREEVDQQFADEKAFIISTIDAL